MRVSKKVKDMLTQKELSLLEQSGPGKAKKDSPARLKQNVKRMRNLRDKYRDLSRRQKLGLRGKKPLQNDAFGEKSTRTNKKAEIFSAALQRLESRLERLQDEAV